MIANLFNRNLRWAAAKSRTDPEYFRRPSAQHSPEYLWVGCSDNWTSAAELVGLDRGEILVHRNVANLAPPQDASFLSTLQFAVEVLGVKHVIVCGHYGCDSVRAALSARRHGFVDHWLQPVRCLCLRHADKLDAILDMDARVNSACELNVREQVASIAANPFVLDAWRRKQALSVHGWIYSDRDGLLRDLETTVRGPRDASDRGGREGIAQGRRGRRP